MSSSDRSAVTPATVCTRRLMTEHDQVTGAIFISRYYTTAGELMRHISSHYGANPLDLYLTEDGKPIKDSDRIKDQQLFLRTRLRGGMPPKRRSTRATSTLDVTKEIYTIRQRLQGELWGHPTGQQNSDRHTLVRKSLQQLRLVVAILPNWMPIHWHGRPVPQPDASVDANGRGWSNRDSKGTGTRLGSHIPQNHAKGSERYVSYHVRGSVDHQSLRTRG
jgi:hypothetical protein